MNFTEYNFLIFFLVVICAYWLLKRRAWQNALLLVASYVFYGWVHPWYAILLGLSSAADYFLALGIAQQPARKKAFLALSIVLNVGVLAFFKYFNFFADDFSRILSGLGLNPDGTLIQILLPLGLSFFTLKKIAYVIDVSRGTFEAVRDPVAFGLFVAFFPQINVGPIDRAQKLIPQIQSERPWKADYFQRAWPLLLMGFFKKIVIADTIRLAVDKVFVLREPSPFLLITATVAFMFQLLADFSGYTDISRGIAFLFGFETSENFNAPFLATTPTEFWNRWHITLSSWLRDYLYIPLGGSRVSSAQHYFNLMFTFLVCGLWHGAGWNYVLWGLFFGVLTVAYRALGLGRKWVPANPVTRFISWAVMFSFLMVAFLLFRIPSFSWLAGVLQRGTFLGSKEEMAVALGTLSTGLFFAAPLLIKHIMDRRLPPKSILFDLYFVAATFAIFFFVNSAAAEFIYAQF
jgi:D-alanyl-lipoteichoic acid acyltransferase DltB (MBOAT superfamily)